MKDWCKIIKTETRDIVAMLQYPTNSILIFFYYKGNLFEGEHTSIINLEEKFNDDKQLEELCIELSDELVKIHYPNG